MPKIIAVDFDNTLCETEYPVFCKPIQYVIDYVLAEKRQGAKLILWTCRTGDDLAAAVRWCAAHGIEFDAINENLPEVIAEYGDDCRKIFADEYIDDKAVTLSEVWDRTVFRTVLEV